MTELHRQSDATRLRILYAIGPGDVVNSYRHWKAGEQLLSETSQTYSSQFFEFCRRHRHDCYALSSFPQAERVQDGQMIIENRPKRLTGGGLKYHLSQALYGLSLIRTALRWRADVVVADSGTTHWVILGLLKPFGIRVVGNLHNVPWPSGFPPNKWVQRLILQSDALFWRRFADAVLCVSPECERQVRQLAGRFEAPAVQYRAQYRYADFSGIPKVPGFNPPLGVMFAGRIEPCKGVFDLLEIVRIVQREAPGKFFFHVCGAGATLQALEATIDRECLTEVIRTYGKLARPALIDVYARCHLVIVPTRSDFCEGMPQVCAEAVLSGRPIVTSRLSNALDVLPGAILEAVPDDPPSYAELLLALLRDPARYWELCEGCSRVARQFCDATQGLTAGLEAALRRL
jgi:glycosyltransferase involved in cell wall biosynthesis